MKTNLFLALLQQRNQYLFHLLVIIILMLIFNLNEISYCAGMESETQNNVETGLVYAQETQSIKQPQNIMQPAMIDNGQNNPESKAADFVVGYVGISSIVLGTYYLGKPFIVFSVIPTIILYIIFSS